MSHDWLVDFYYWMPHLIYSIRNYLSLIVEVMVERDDEANENEETYRWKESLAEK